MKQILQLVSVLVVVLCVMTVPLFAEGKVDINKADAEALMSLKGIGEAKAQAIIEYRETNGPFASLEDLQNVPGVGETILADNAGHIVASTEAGTSTTEAATEAPEAPAKE